MRLASRHLRRHRERPRVWSLGRRRMRGRMECRLSECHGMTRWASAVRPGRRRGRHLLIPRLLRGGGRGQEVKEVDTLAAFMCAVKAKSMFNELS